MTKTLKKLRYTPNYKLKSKTIILKDNIYNNLPPISLTFKQKLLPGNGFVSGPTCIKIGYSSREPGKVLRPCNKIGYSSAMY